MNKTGWAPLLFLLGLSSGMALAEKPGACRHQLSNDDNVCTLEIYRSVRFAKPEAPGVNGDRIEV